MNAIAAGPDISPVPLEAAAHGMGDPLAPDYLERQGSYGLLSIVVGTALALGVLYFLYVVGGFGSREITDFRDRCHQREVQAAAHLAAKPDYDQIILKCERELREFLRRR